MHIKPARVHEKQICLFTVFIVALNKKKTDLRKKLQYNGNSLRLSPSRQAPSKQTSIIRCLRLFRTKCLLAKHNKCLEQTTDNTTRSEYVHVDVLFGSSDIASTRTPPGLHKSMSKYRKSRAFSLIYCFPGFDCEHVYGESVFVCAVHQAGKQTPSALKKILSFR